MSESLALPPTPAAPSMFANAQLFALVQDQAKLVAASSLVPATFQGNVANCAIALEMAGRLQASPMAVMQNLDVIHGRPSWRAVFLMGLVNNCGRFTPLQFKLETTGTEKTADLIIEYWTGSGNNRTKAQKTEKYVYTPTRCVAWARDRQTGDVIEGPPVSYDMAIQEGWVGKDGSKWKTEMRELMLRYRAASFFAKVYASDVMLGMQTTEEVEDMPRDLRTVSGPATTIEDAFPKSPSPEVLPDSAVQTGRTSRAARNPVAKVPADEPPAHSGATQPESTHGEAGRIVIFERYETQNGEKNGKPWTKFIAHYTEAGVSKQADTFSGPIGEVLATLEENCRVTIETTPNANPRYADKLEAIALVPNANGGEVEW